MPRGDQRGAQAGQQLYRPLGIFPVRGGGYRWAAHLFAPNDGVKKNCRSSWWSPHRRPVAPHRYGGRKPHGLVCVRESRLSPSSEDPVWLASAPGRDMGFKIDGVIWKKPRNPREESRRTQIEGWVVSLTCKVRE